MMAFSQFQRCLRPAPPTPPDHWSAPAPPSPLQSPPHRLHPTRNCLSSGHADSVRLRITGTTRETLTEPEQVRPGEESGTAHTHPRLHPASREQTLLRPRGVMSAPPSAPPPDIRQQSSSQPTHHAADSQSLLEACCRSPQRGQRYPDVRQPAPQSATHSGWSERGRCALTDASSPLPSSPASGPHRSSPLCFDRILNRIPCLIFSYSLSHHYHISRHYRLPSMSARSIYCLILSPLLYIHQEKSYSYGHYL